MLEGVPWEASQRAFASRTAGTHALCQVEQKTKQSLDYVVNRLGQTYIPAICRYVSDRRPLHCVGGVVYAAFQAFGVSEIEGLTKSLSFFSSEQNGKERGGKGGRHLEGRHSEGGSYDRYKCVQRKQKEKAVKNGKQNDGNLN